MPKCRWIAIILLMVLSGDALAVQVVTREFFSFNSGGGPNMNYNILDPDNGTGINFAAGGIGLTPIGTNTSPTLPPFPAVTFNNDFGANDFFAVRLTGTFDVAADAVYSFTTGSDDGSYLFINGGLVVDNGGRHGTTNVTGNVFLAAGQHAFELQFAEDDGGNTLGIQLPAGVTVPELSARFSVIPLLFLGALLLLFFERRSQRHLPA